MKLSCALGRHEAGSDAIWNQGYYFSRCEHCECDLVKASGRWGTVPKGYRIVWRRKTSPMPDWNAGVRRVPEGSKLSDILIPQTRRPEPYRAAEPMAAEPIGA